MLLFCSQYLFGADYCDTKAKKRFFCRIELIKKAIYRACYSRVLNGSALGGSGAAYIQKVLMLSITCIKRLRSALELLGCLISSNSLTE
jgi:hypothetical protein